MGVFNSVYVLKPINKTTAKGIASGSIVSEWRTPAPTEHCAVMNVKKRKKNEKKRQEDRRKGEEWYRWANNAKIEPRRLWRVIEVIVEQFNAERDDVERIVQKWFQEGRISNRANGVIAWTAHKKGGGR